METVTQDSTEIVVDAPEAGVGESIDARVMKAGIAALEATEAGGNADTAEPEGLDDEKIKAAMAVSSRSTR